MTKPKMTIASSILILTIATLNGAQAGQTEILKDNNERMRCRERSPSLGMKYGHEYQHDVALPPFCLDHSKRTCCDKNNLYRILKRASRMSKNTIKRSKGDYECSKMLQEMLCMECDGDIGIGMKRGICPSLCHKIYGKCKSSFFFYDGNLSQERLSLCEHDSLICSPLDSLTTGYEDACEKLGYKVNERSNTESNIFEFFNEMNDYSGGKSTDDYMQGYAVCYNNRPSSSIYGRATKSIGYRKFSGVFTPLYASLMLLLVFN